ncbi:unnamed protein product [Durusdinium trenchii]|uniref:Uncharacterized protein n=1 Tax=Durusdinium trenchii TaxID=1381693 RepID=A0ABP0KYV4_9DINO
MARVFRSPRFQYVAQERLHATPLVRNISLSTLVGEDDEGYGAVARAPRSQGPSSIGTLINGGLCVWFILCLCLCLCLIYAVHVGYNVAVSDQVLEHDPSCNIDGYKKVERDLKKLGKSAEGIKAYFDDDRWYCGKDEKTLDSHNYRSCVRDCIEEALQSKFDKGLGDAKVKQRLTHCVKRCNEKFSQPSASNDSNATNFTGTSI